MRQQLKRVENRTHRDDSRLTMKSKLIAIVAAVLLLGCGESSIHDAAIDGNIEAVKQHLTAGVDVNVKDKLGWTPLHYAARYGRKEVAELLIAKGGHVNAKNIDSETPLDWAISRKHPEIADLLRKHGGKTPETDRALHVAVRTGNVQAAKKHLDAGADVNAKMWRRTPFASCGS